MTSCNGSTAAGLYDEGLRRCVLARAGLHARLAPVLAWTWAWPGVAQGLGLGQVRARLNPGDPRGPVSWSDFHYPSRCLPMC